MGEAAATVTFSLYLVRHGESEWNRLSRYAGRSDVPLSSVGREQARRLAERLEREDISGIYASPLQRASETASIIGERLGLPVVIEPGLAEIHHGAWEGLTAHQVRAEFAREYAQWQAQPHRVLMPGGEALADVAARVKAFLGQIRSRADHANFVVCSHDAVLRVFLSECLGLGLEHFWKWSFENASLTTLQALDHPDTFRLAGLNDTAHLAGIQSEYAAQAL